MLSDKTLRLVVDPSRAEAEFIARVLATYSVRRQIANSGTGSSGSMKNISQDDIRSFLVPYPPLDEQRLILMRLRGIEGQAQVERRKLVKLRSLRQGLMEDLLTGRVRVKDSEERVEAEV
jgi:type I restriction enzyme S subunit